MIQVIQIGIEMVSSLLFIIKQSLKEICLLMQMQEKAKSPKQGSLP